MIANLKFDLEDPDDRAAHKRCISATDAYLALWELQQEIFRPARKHGYDDLEINELLAADSDDIALDVIGLLESKFFEILERNGIKLEDLP